MSNGPQIEMEARGVDKAALDIHSMGPRAEDPTPIWSEMNAVFHDDESARFSRNGPGWDQLNDATLENKARLGQSPQLLRATGRLYRSLTTGATGRSDSRHGELVFGTDVEYALFHQYGTSKMPRRSLIQLSPRGRAAMEQKMLRFIVEGKR